MRSVLDPRETRTRREANQQAVAEAQTGQIERVGKVVKQALEGSGLSLVGVSSRGPLMLAVELSNGLGFTLSHLRSDQMIEQVVKQHIQATTKGQP